MLSDQVTYDLVGAAPPGKDLFYFAFISRSAIIRRSAMATSSRSNIGVLSPPWRRSTASCSSA